MRKLWPIALALCLWLTIAPPRDAWGSGELLPVDPVPDCYGDGPKNATFTPARSTYSFAGSCPLTLAQTRANLPVTVPWTGVGTYDPPTGSTTEDIDVPAPRPDQPSRPYGHFHTTMHCSSDPWLNPTIRCDNITPSVYAPLDKTAPNAMGYTPYPLGPIITDRIMGYGRPYTSLMTQDAVNKLAALQQAALAAYRKGGEIRQATPEQAAISQVFSPSIVYPMKGENFFAQTPIPIKLASPPALTVTGYMVSIEMNGHPLCDIPLGAADAQSTAGYRGWGAGKPPCFLAVPGTFRLRAQVSSPRQSGWSDWVEFTVSPPRFTAPSIMRRGIEGEQPEPTPSTSGTSEQPSGKKTE